MAPVYDVLNVLLPKHPPHPDKRIFSIDLEVSPETLTVANLFRIIGTAHDEQCSYAHSTPWTASNGKLYINSKPSAFKPGDFPRLGKRLGDKIIPNPQDSVLAERADMNLRDLIGREIKSFLFFERLESHDISPLPAPNVLSRNRSHTAPEQISTTPIDSFPESSKRSLSHVETTLESRSAKRPNTLPSLKPAFHSLIPATKPLFITTVESNGRSYQYKLLERVSRFEEMLDERHTLVVDQSAIIFDICNIVQTQRNKILLLRHFDPISLGFIATTVLSYFDINFLSKFPHFFESLAVCSSTRNRPVLEPSQNLVWNISFLSFASVHEDSYETRMRSALHNSVRKFCRTYHDQIGTVDLSADRDLALDIENVLEAVQKASLKMVICIQGYDTVSNRLWEAAFLNSTNNQTRSHSTAALWLKDFLLLAASHSRSVLFILLCGERPSAALDMKAVDFQPFDLSALPSLSTIGTIPNDSGRAIMSWIYGPDAPPDVVDARCKEVELAAGKYLHSDALGDDTPARENFGLRSDVAFDLFNAALRQRGEPSLRLPAVRLNLELSDPRASLLAIAFMLTEAEDMDRILPMLIPGSTVPYLLPNTLQPLGYSHLPRLDHPTEPPSTTPLFVPTKKVMAAVPGAVMQLLFHFGLVTYAYIPDPKNSSTHIPVMTFANEACKAVVSKVATLRLHSLNIAHPRSRSMIRESIQNVYGHFPARMIDDIDESRFQHHLIFLFNVAGSTYGCASVTGELKLIWGGGAQLSDVTVTDAPESQSTPTCSGIELKIAKLRAMMDGTFGHGSWSATSNATIATQFFFHDKFRREKLQEARADLQELLSNHPDFWTNPLFASRYRRDGPGKPAFLNFDSMDRKLTWKDLVFVFTENGTTYYRSVDAHFRKGIEQAKTYQELLMRGSVNRDAGLPRIQGESLSGIDDMRIHVKEAPKGEFTMVEAEVWMMVGGSFIVYYKLPAKQSGFIFSTQPDKS